jgi:hypothetical protein
MKTQRLENITSKALKDFTPGDTLHIQKIVGGYSFSFLCEFVKLKRAVVTAKIINLSEGEERFPLWPCGYSVGGVITASAAKCYLWGKIPNQSIPWAMCHWFKDTKHPAGY